MCYPGFHNWLVCCLDRFSEVKSRGMCRGRSDGGSVYVLGRAAVNQLRVDVICDACVDVDEGNQSRTESNNLPLTSL